MIRLIKYEFYKTVSQKFIYVVFLCGAAIYVYTTRAYYMQNESSVREHIVDFPYHFGSVFIGAVILLSLSSVFSGEHEKNTICLIQVAKYGRCKTAAAKIISSIIFAVFTVVISYAVDFIVNASWRDVSGFNYSIRTLKSFSKCPYGFSIMQYFYIAIAFTALGTVAFSIFILCLSAAGKNTMTAFVIGSSVFGISYIIHDTNGFCLKWILKNISYSDIMRVRNLFNRPRIYEIGGICISHAALVSAAALSASVIFIILILSWSKKREL